ncbi:MAG: tRNA (adenosine(37)-N6)-dimethylallyltransferase MiaA [Elusimicrobia bacterium]|nr:tRNA (adenosine(37)-N6)-dimethylallyltransferase MiaA [Elusimicrobiota bacterium]
MPLLQPLQKSPKARNALSTTLLPVHKNTTRHHPFVVAILGPTASGKTALAVRLAKRLGAEVVSCDSRNFYKGLHALTSTPAGRWTDDGKTFTVDDAVPYHLVDFLDHRQRWDAQQYATAAREVLDDIFSRSRCAIVAGGSGFYWRALNQGLDEAPPVDDSLRRELNQRLNNEGLPALSEELKRLDPKTHQSIDRQNPRRVLRALELCRQLGRPLSEIRSGPKTEKNHFWPHAAFYLDWPRSALKQRIERRIRRFLGSMTEELNGLKNKHGESIRQWPVFESLSAEPVWDMIHGRISREETVARSIKLEFAYARRQETWFKKEKNLVKISFNEESDRDERLMFERAEQIIMGKIPQPCR